VFERIRKDFLSFAARLGIPELRFIPLSALRGDLIVNRGAGMAWYTGPTLLATLEQIDARREVHALPARFPVQLVVRPGSGSDFRGYAGRLESGLLAPGDELLALPSGRRSVLRDIVFHGKKVSEATAGDSVTLVLSDDIDVSRGDMLVTPSEPPGAAKSLHARLCWFSETPLDRSARFVLKHTTRTVKAKLAALIDRLDINTLERELSPAGLSMNDIAHVSLSLAQPIFVDPYDRNRATGSFILIDEVTHHTLAAGMIEA
jgi:sulfate adenylyltransferase subunit 1